MLDNKREKNLVIDGMNFFHRARSGMTQADNAVTFNFFRNLRALVEKINAEKIFFVLEGKPCHRLSIFSEYKSNRLLDIEATDYEKKLKEKEDFHRQKNEALSLLKNYFPVSVLKHSNFECDDVIYNLVKTDKSVEWVIVSTDTDFIQILNECPNVSLYNPVKKEFIESAEYDYVVWKSLKGDSSDGIPGIPGVGEKTAEKISKNKEKLETFLKNEENKSIFERNYSLIKLKDFSNKEYSDINVSKSENKNWESVFLFFEQKDFKSLLTDKSKEKLVKTFERFW